MAQSQKLTFLIGRLLFSLSLITLGILIFLGGHPVYDKYLHAFRKMFLPETQGSSKAPFGDITYEQLNQYIVMADGLLFMISGLLIMANQKRMGGVMLVAAMTIVLMSKDNPWLRTKVKSIELEQGQRNKDFIKHVGVIGGVILLLINQ